MYSNFNHPNSVCMTYFQHMFFSLEMSYLMGKGCICALIHSFIPSFFIKTTTNINNSIRDKLNNSGCRDKI
jgi:hypothetical protein